MSFVDLYVAFYLHKDIIFLFLFFSLSAQSIYLFFECMKPVRRRSREKIIDFYSKSVAKSCETLTNVDVAMTYVFDDRVVVILSTSTITKPTIYTSFITGYQGINNYNVFNMITIFRVHPVINSGRFLIVRTMTCSDDVGRHPLFYVSLQ